MTVAVWRERFDGVRRGVAFGLPVRIMSVSSQGVRCKFPDGRVERLHPDDIRIEAPATGRATTS